MTTIIVRVLIIYILILFVFRLMGKRQIAQMQPFEFVLTLIIADLATIPMAEIALPLLNGIVPMLFLVVLQYAITILTRKSIKFSNLISGKPIIIVTPHGVDYNALKKLNITIQDLFEALRVAGYFNLSEIQYAIMETNGEVSVMPKSAFAPVSALDLKIKKEESYLPYTIISEGQFLDENISLSKHNKLFYKNILNKLNIKSIKSVLLLTIDDNGEIYFQKKYEPAKTLSLEQLWKELLE